MTIKKKGTDKKLIIAIALVAVLVIAIVAIIYSTQSHSSSGNGKLVGVQVGDTFTYSITGSSEAPVSNVDYPGFYELNETQYYKVAVIGVEGPSVILTTDWVFKNGTDIKQQQTIDLVDGMITDPYGFSFIYPANLKVNDPIYPVNNTVLVNETLTQPYASGPRESDYYHVSTTEYYANDPTQSTQRQLYDEVYFDRQTGMLTNFDEIQVYNSPELELEVIYTLTNSTVWNV